MKIKEVQNRNSSVPSQDKSRNEDFQSFDLQKGGPGWRKDRREKRNVGDTPGTPGFPSEADFVSLKGNPMGKEKTCFILSAAPHGDSRLANKINCLHTSE